MLEPDTQEFAPDWFSKPADSLLGLMRRRELSAETVASALDGGIDTLRGLIRGTRAVDDALASALSTTVGGSPTFWLKRQESYDRALEAALLNTLQDADAWLERVPAPGAMPRGRIAAAQKPAEVRRRMAFYGVNTLKTWETRYSQTRDETRFRTSKAFSSGEGAISLWLRQGELEAALMNTRPWDPDKLRSSLRDMLKLSTIRHPERFLPKLLAIGAEAGVAIVIAKAPQGCKASGASRLVEPAKAMILLSFRHLADDHFWFTLLHEAGHLLLHGAKTFVDGDDTEPDQWEHEADEFAASQIIPSKRWNEVASLDYDKETVLRLAVSLGIGPGLIVGQLQHQGLLGRNRLNFLKRRWTWDQITAVAIP